MLTPERLRELLHYNQETGEFVWLANYSNCRAGDRAGSLHRASGYRRIQIDRRIYFEHRLVWLYVYGRFPGVGVDHINGDRADNRLVNLREADKSQNAQNIRRPMRNNKSGILGVHSHQGKWRAEIKADGTRHDLGCYATPEEAHSAYLEAKARLHPFSTFKGAL